MDERELLRIIQDAAENEHCLISTASNCANCRRKSAN